MDPIITPRLRLVAATATLTQLEIEHLPQFFKQLRVEPAPDWPSDNLRDVLPFFRDQLAGNASLVGWLSWYWILDESDGAKLVGGGGFKGAPSDGMVEIGYEVRAACRGKGYATEAVGAQVAWAMSHPDVLRVIAETHIDNAASMGVLKKLGFRPVGPGSEHELLRFERRTDRDVDVDTFSQPS
ncbi:GNAT family N-acetyltransferase [Candidatus Bipolaricaulota bacterium]|nr:GNAT family N-acetyltransferase [Candidatus Bipolaricaulota bacterium]